jgi:hypothetical protein
VPGNDVGLADDQLDVKCSQPVKKKKVTTVCNETYAEVDKTSNRTQLGQCSATEGKVLQYVISCCNIQIRKYFKYNGVNVIFWNII